MTIFWMIVMMLAGLLVVHPIIELLNPDIWTERCPKCKKELSMKEQIPVIRYLVYHGRTKCCNTLRPILVFDCELTGLALGATAGIIMAKSIAPIGIVLLILAGVGCLIFATVAHQSAGSMPLTILILGNVLTLTMQQASHTLIPALLTTALILAVCMMLNVWMRADLWVFALWISLALNLFGIVKTASALLIGYAIIRGVHYATSIYRLQTNADGFRTIWPQAICIGISVVTAISYL